MSERHPPLLDFSEEQIALIKALFGSQDLTDDEFALFLYVCQVRGLNPLLREIYAVKRKGKMTIQVGIDGYRSIAERTGCYCPGETVFSETPDGRLVSATTSVWRFLREEWREIKATAFYREYVQTAWNERENRVAPVSMWQKMPRNQTAKCSEALALRKAFPQQLAGMYVEEEMQQADSAAAPELPAIVPAQAVAPGRPEWRPSVPAIAPAPVEVVTSGATGPPALDPVVAVVTEQVAQGALAGRLEVGFRGLPDRTADLPEALFEDPAPAAGASLIPPRLSLPDNFAARLAAMPTDEGSGAEAALALPETRKQIQALLREKHRGARLFSASESAEVLAWLSEAPSGHPDATRFLAVLEVLEAFAAERKLVIAGVRR